MATAAAGKKKEKKKQQPPLAKTRSEEDYTYRGLTRLGQQYGPVFRVDMGYWKIVVLNSYDVMKEAFVQKGQVFGGRPFDPKDKLINPNHPKILGIQGDSYGEEWKAQRSTTMKLLSRIGFGKEKSQRIIQNEALKLIEHFKSFRGEATDPTDPIGVAVSNVVSGLVFGETHPIGDEDFSRVVKSVFLLADLYFKRAEEDYSLSPFKSRAYKEDMERFKQAGARMNKYVEARIKAREAILDPTKEPGNFIDAYLAEFKKSQADPADDKTGAIIKENWLLNIVTDLMEAGFESSAVALRWLLLYMLHHPDIMARVQAEVDAVCGACAEEKTRVPDYADRTETPYTVAVIYEVLRHASIAHFTLAHETMEDTELGEFFIPKKTEVWGNLYAALHDESVFPDPHRFNPDRFFNEDGDLEKPVQWIPFSMGRRSCMGELLARTEIYVMFSALMRNFSVSSGAGTGSLPDLEPVESFVLHPKEFSCVFTHRL